MRDAGTRSVLLLGGPTASGKSVLAVELARRFDAEIVNADSRQIYRDMPIGTAAPSAEALAAVPHHLFGFLDPRERYSAARFARDALAAIDAIHARGRRAIVVGGTGFYLRALRGGVDCAPQPDPELRERLAREAHLHAPEFLHAWLRLRDPARAAALHPRDVYRVLRALEVALTRRGDGAARALPSLARARIEHVLVVVDVPLEELDARIARRSAGLLEAGFLDEAARLGGEAAAADAVGYPAALGYLRGWSTQGELRVGLERATRRYARRQRAWFRREPEAIWLPAADVETFAREKLGWDGKVGR